VVLISAERKLASLMAVISRFRTLQSHPNETKLSSKKPLVAARSFDKTDVPNLCAPFAAMPFGEAA
jgi:hypothetical protein